MTPGYLDRRRHHRFPVSMAVEYRLRSGGGGVGTAQNMGSGGLFFQCNQVLPPGELIEVDLTWPVSQEGHRPLELRFRGLILRSSEEGTAMSVSKYEFRLPDS